MGILQLYNADSVGRVTSRAHPLPDCDSATVRQEVNGEFSLTATMPAGARFEDEVQDGMAIKALVDELGTEQKFIIKKRDRSLDGGLRIYAEHQSYYYRGVVVEPFEGGLAAPSAFLNRLRLNANPSLSGIGTMTSERSDTTHVWLKGPDTPKAMRELLLQWLVQNLGGELAWDGFDLTWVDQLGANRGVTYRYAANLLTLETEDILDGYFSGIYPFWGRLGDSYSPLVEISGKIIEFSGSYPMRHIIPLDLSDQFANQPTAAELQARAEAWAAVNAPGAIPVSIAASRARLEGDKPVLLGDTIRIVNSRWGLDASIRVMALTFDALRERVQDVQLGAANPGFPGAVKNMK